MIQWPYLPPDSVHPLDNTEVVQTSVDWYSTFMRLVTTFCNTALQERAQVTGYHIFVHQILRSAEARCTSRQRIKAGTAVSPLPMDLTLPRACTYS
jgi:hypothetical protein